ncbi:MAG TPA: hypothetical protein VFW40_04100 [Capsulimonadaceae bacterium]|nr:hypothetical protein [Capsulimonadaceae bacterium]
MSKWILYSLMCLALLSPLTSLAASDGSVEAKAKSTLQIASWSPYEQGYVLDRQVHRVGTPSIRCETTRTDAKLGACSVVTLNQSTPAPILISGWSRAQDVGGAPDTEYSIYVDITYADGTFLWAQTVSFDTGTHGWQKRHLLIVPEKPVKSFNLYALFRNHAGTVWFSDFDTRVVSPSSLFDGQAIPIPVLPAKASSGWFIRDVAANTPPAPLMPGFEALGVRLDNVRPSRNGQLMETSLRNETAHNRSVTVYYVERVPAENPIWWDDIRSPIPVKGNEEYANLAPVNVGANGHISLYPFGCVTGNRVGRALGVPPWLGPRVVRIGYNSRAHLLFLACDLALMAKNNPAGHDHAPLAVVSYGADPQWGFRDAAAKYYALFPKAYQRRAKAEGIWMPFESPENVQNLADFHFAFHEGDNSVSGDRQNHILSFRYVEPMTYWMPMPAGMPRDYAHAMELVNQESADSKQGEENTRRQAQAVLYSGTQDATGGYNISFRDTPWCDGAVWVLDPNPSLPHPAGSWTKALLNSAGEPTFGQPDQPDGEYLDSLEAQADVLNYRPESLKAATVALTFTPDDFRPTLPTWFSVYEAAAGLSADLHEHNKLLMANTTPWRFYAFPPLLDVLGTEVNMFSDSGAWSPEPDSIMNLRRTLAYHKPYLLLLNTDFNKASSGGIKKYFQRCLFYGIYPSMFSADAADNPYWQDPKLYNRDRPLFKTYIPVVQKLSSAGWEPITWARSNNKTVWVERYGARYFTVLNSSDSLADATIKIDANRLIPGGSYLTVKDLLAGSDLNARATDGAVSVHMSLQPSETRVLYLQTTRDVSARSGIAKESKTNE